MNDPRKADRSQCREKERSEKERREKETARAKRAVPYAANRGAMQRWIS
ncbi:hypothetical protein J5226_22395 [Lysobacter sp. K5869]|nr:hypothetical protein [Lysobacter sp. K5869]QWP76304.1 hypothetical protein J5226_22395 [Lysobacter sp. K5869]